MAAPISMTADETRRALEMVAAVLHLVSANVARRDGRLGREQAERLSSATRGLWNGVDVALALELADRIGEDALRQAIDDNTPQNFRAGIDARFKAGGSVLSALKERIARLDVAAEARGAATSEEAATGCALGALATVAGVAVNTLVGGFAAAVGVVVMAESC